jgi:hypothetical protein
MFFSTHSTSTSQPSGTPGPKMKDEVLHEVVRASPPVSVGGMALWGVQIEQWLILLTIVYTIFLIIDKSPNVIARLRALWKWLRRK